MITFAAAFAGNMMAGVSAQQPQPPLPQAVESAAPARDLTPETINGARLQDLLTPAADPPGESPATPDPVVVKLQILLDRAGASPGVIDGLLGDNVQKAIHAFEQMRELPADGVLDAEVMLLLETQEPVIGHYAVTADDQEDVVAPLPEDYAELAELEFLGYESVPEAIAERFHMGEDLLAALNPDSGFAPGDNIFVAAYGPDRTGEVVRIEADKALRQVRAYDAEGALLAAYPATIGSEQNPSPSGVHEVTGVAPMPTYTYDPTINFQQGDNTEVLTLPPGPNGPVGSMWIDLSEPTYGIHGTPEPALIDKVASHGCVRLTNWDAEELAAMTSTGVTVEFLEP
jgi:lipoprotein-anchoring transpeptidase ErfK/SrfK